MTFWTRIDRFLKWLAGTPSRKIIRVQVSIGELRGDRFVPDMARCHDVHETMTYLMEADDMVQLSAHKAYWVLARDFEAREGRKKK